MQIPGMEIKGKLKPMQVSSEYIIYENFLIDRSAVLVDIRM